MVWRYYRTLGQPSAVYSCTVEGRCHPVSTRSLVFIAAILSAGVVMVPTGSAQPRNAYVSADAREVPVTAALYPPLTAPLVAAVNEQQASADMHVVISVATVSAREMPDARQVAREMMANGGLGCRLGSGALVVASGYVKGSFSRTKRVMAVFVNPAGDHGGISAGGAQPSATHSDSPSLNWYVGFLIPGGRVVAVRPDGASILGPNLFCASGYSPDLRRLPTHPGQAPF
jgi:hypothetical protein